MNNVSIDENGQTFKIGNLDSILRAGLRSGLGFPYECNSGGCGSCKFQLLEGEVKNLWKEAPGLTRRDIRKEKKLACQSLALTDCKIKVKLDRCFVPKIIPSRKKIIFMKSNKLTPDMAEFIFKSDTPAEFLPGQFALLSLPDVEGDRAYSMSNLPNDNGLWKFIIKKVPGGKVSNYLFDQINYGDSLELDAPYGLAYLRSEIAREIVCIGGGSGLSPMISIILAIVKDPLLNDRDLYFFYGGRRPEDLCTSKFISELENMNGNIYCYNAISDALVSEQEDWDGEVCFIHELVEKTLGGRMKNFEYYFSGPPPMAEAVQKMLMLDNKVSFEQLHFDRFF